MRTRDDFRRLMAELAVDMETLAILFDKNRTMTERLEHGADTEFDYAALGYTLHNLYCCQENYFLRVAKFFENGLDPATWHRDLIDRMVVEIPGLRPRLLDRDLAGRLDELRGFRHRFRNVYQSSLDPERIRVLNGKVPGLVADFRTTHGAFLATLEYLAAGLQG